jgi:UDPglucose--hexose-1-phosphate uridylyltransferase
MKNQTIKDFPHRRYNSLIGEWILVSPHRAKRPWQGQVETIQKEKRPKYNEICYLCPTNTRADGISNPNYENTFVFDNDFSSLLPGIPSFKIDDDELFQAKSERGICKVICFSPRHDLTIPDMNIKDIIRVIETWQHEYKKLGKEVFINYVQIFENKGSIMGCSNPHPHGQIWAQESVPDIPLKEDLYQKQFFENHSKSLLLEYLQKEMTYNERIVYENKHFVVLCPFWATWPFETIIISKRHLQNINQLSSEEKYSFAEAYKTITLKYDKLFDISFPYSAGIHQSPTNGKENKHWHFHMHFYPPLLRSATVKKFMVGYEMLANAQRDITPEESAFKLKDL